MTLAPSSGGHCAARYVKQVKGHKFVCVLREEDDGVGFVDIDDVDINDTTDDEKLCFFL